MSNATRDEVMTVMAARALSGHASCLVGIGVPSAAANLARRIHNPDLVLVYESGTIGSKPAVLPLSIGDGELAETADSVVSVPEIFAYWLQAGRIDVGFLAAAQIDRYANLNSTVIGSYDAPKVRLPGAGGAPEIAAGAREVLIVIRHARDTFVEQLDFITTSGFMTGGDSRQRSGVRGKGPSRVITDLGLLEPHADTRELTLVAVHPGVTVQDVRDATGWALRVSDNVIETEPVTAHELDVLRDLHARTTAAHARNR